jgi:HlyD family secretion protein
VLPVGRDGISSILGRGRNREAPTPKNGSPDRGFPFGAIVAGPSEPSQVRIFIVVVVVLVAGLAAAAMLVDPKDGFDGLSFSFAKESKGVEVRTDPVRRDTLIETVSAPGEIEPDLMVDLSAEVSARILELPFREGGEVEAGDVVVRLDDSELRSRLDAARARREGEQFRLEAERARLAGPKHSLENARTALERQQSLFESGDVSRQALDDALNRVAELEATVEAGVRNISVIESGVAAAAADIAQVEELIAKTVIRSPISGTLIQLNAEVGELVVVGTMNNAGTVILTIANLRRMRLDARVAESAIARVEDGQAAEVRINAYPDRVFRGTVERVALQRTVDRDGTGYFKVEVMLALDGERILSGLAANVEIEVAEREGLLVPSQSIVDVELDALPEEIARGDRLVDRRRRSITAVYVVAGDRAVLTPVRVGPSNLVDTLVLEGLDEGAAVVSGPYKALETLAHEDLVAIEGVEQETGSEESEATRTAAADTDPA